MPLVSFGWQELYLSLFTELGKLLMYDRLFKATEKKDSLHVKVKYTIETIVEGAVMEQEQRGALLIFTFCQLAKGSAYFCKLN